MSVKMPAVHIPTLRPTTHYTNAATAVASNANVFVQPVAVLETLTLVDDNSVAIDELVNGVRQCQAAVKRAGDVLRRQQQQQHGSPDATAATNGATTQPRRVRSPTPIGDRKPWGAHHATTSPRKQRSGSASSANAATASTTTTVPTTTTSRVQRTASATAMPNVPSRPHTPTSSSADGPAKPTLKSPPHTARHIAQLAASTTNTAPRPKLESHHTPPTTARRTAASAAPTAAASVVVSPAKTIRHQQHTSTSINHQSPNHNDRKQHQELEVAVTQLSEQVKVLTDRLVLSMEHTHQLEGRNAELERRVMQMQKDSDATQIAARQQFLHFSAQQQHMWEVIRRMESFLVVSDHNSGDSHGDDDADFYGHQRSTAVTVHHHNQQQSAVAAAAPMQQQQHAHHHMSQQQLYQHQQQHYRQHYDPLVVQSDSPSFSPSTSLQQRGAEDIGGSVARRLDMSNESNGSGQKHQTSFSRVPPNPPMELRQS